MYRFGMVLLLFLCCRAAGQEHRLQGVLLNKNTAAIIPGAVLVAPTDSTVSRPDGQFMVKMRPEDTLLKVIHPFYQTSLIPLSPEQSFVTLFMQPLFNTGNTADSIAARVDSASPYMAKAIKAYMDETYKKEEENPFIKTAKVPYSGFTLNSSHASYNNIRRFIHQNKKVPPASVRIAEMLNYFPFTDSLPVTYPGRPLQAFADLATCPWNADHWLMRVAVQSEKKPDTLSRSGNIVLLIDVSGSMNQADKLPLLKIAFRKLVNHLTYKDTLAIVIYTDKARLALPPTPGMKKKEILETIDHLYAGGSTAGSTGIEMAFALAKKHFIPNGNNRVILATDGDFNVGASSDPAMKSLITRYRDWGISITCIGVGTGNYKDSKLETLAHWGQGRFVYLDNKEEAQRLYAQENMQKMFVTARDVRVKMVFNPNWVQAFRLIGYDSGGSRGKLAFTGTLHEPGGETGGSQRMTTYYELIPDKIPAGSDRKRNSLATLILQYKGFHEKSKYQQIYQVPAYLTSFKEKNSSWRFGASVLLLGMLLQQSEYTGTGTYSLAAKIARKAQDALPKEAYKHYQKLLRQAEKIPQ